MTNIIIKKDKYFNRDLVCALLLWKFWFVCTLAITFMKKLCEIAFVNITQRHRVCVFPCGSQLIEQTLEMSEIIPTVT